MSQNLDATAINQIHALISAQGVNEIISKIGADAVALPENFRIHDLEKFNLNRFRFRGALSTASIDDFTRYSKDLADEGTRCFIDADNMRAVSVLNLGTIDEPGHADNTSTLKLKKTAPFSALLSVNGERHSQKSLAEWIEDWADYLVGFDANGDAIQATKAAAAVRKITIEANQTADFEDNDFSGKRSLMESVEAKTKDIMPTERRDLGLDDGSFWPVLEGIPATEMFNVIPLAPGHVYGMFMERFNDLSELRKCA